MAKGSWNAKNSNANLGKQGVVVGSSGILLRPSHYLKHTAILVESMLLSSCQNSILNSILLKSVGAEQKVYTGLTLLPQAKKNWRQIPFAHWAVFL